MTRQRNETRRETRLRRLLCLVDLAYLILLIHLDVLEDEAVDHAGDGEEAADDGAAAGDEVNERLGLLDELDHDGRELVAHEYARQTRVHHHIVCVEDLGRLGHRVLIGVVYNAAVDVLVGGRHYLQKVRVADAVRLHGHAVEHVRLDHVHYAAVGGLARLRAHLEHVVLVGVLVAERERLEEVARVEAIQRHVFYIVHMLSFIC